MDAAELLSAAAPGADAVIGAGTEMMNLGLRGVGASHLWNTNVDRQNRMTEWGNPLMGGITNPSQDMYQRGTDMLGGYRKNYGAGVSGQSMGFINEALSGGMSPEQRFNYLRQMYGDNVGDIRGAANQGFASANEGMDVTNRMFDRFRADDQARIYGDQAGALGESNRIAGEQMGQIGNWAGAQMQNAGAEQAALAMDREAQIRQAQTLGNVTEGQALSQSGMDKYRAAESMGNQRLQTTAAEQQMKTSVLAEQAQRNASIQQNFGQMATQSRQQFGQAQAQVRTSYDNIKSGITQSLMNNLQGAGATGMGAMVGAGGQIDQTRLGAAQLASNNYQFDANMQQQFNQMEFGLNQQYASMLTQAMSESFNMGMAMEQFNMAGDQAFVNALLGLQVNPGAFQGFQSTFNNWANYGAQQAQIESQQNQGGFF